MVTLFAILILSSTVKTTDDLYAISYDGPIEDLVNSDGQDELYKFFNNIPGKLGDGIGTRKLYLHQVAYNILGLTMGVLTSNVPYIQNVNGKVQIFNTDLGIRNYEGALISPGVAMNQTNKWAEATGYNISQSVTLNGALYIKLKQNTTAVDQGGSTNFASTEASIISMPLNLKGYRGYGVDEATDFYLTVYCSSPY